MLSYLTALSIITSLARLAASDSSSYSAHEAVASPTLSLLGNSSHHLKKSRVSIHIPFKLHNASGEEHIMASFGVGSELSSSGSISAFMYFLDSDLCNGLHWNDTAAPLYPSAAMTTTPFILMANHHGVEDCSPVIKARHAQHAGAAALLLADTTCRCSDTACTKQFGPNCVDYDPFLANDGSGADIGIPVFMLFRTKAAAIQDEMKKHQQSVLMELGWGLPEGNTDGTGVEGNHTNTSSAHVYYHLWTTAHDPIVDIITYKNLRTVASAFANSSATNNQSVVEFAPRLSILDGSKFQCNAQVDMDGPCDHLCTNHGRYCAVHARQLSGHAIVTETTRRLCIWHELNKKKADKHQSKQQLQMGYWDYLVYHVEHCYAPHDYLADECVKNAYAAAGIDAHAVHDCMGDLEADSAHPILEEALGHQERAGVVVLPALTVNHDVLEHGVTSYGLFDAICEEFWLRHETSGGVVSVPEICHTCFACPNRIGCIVHGGKCVDFSDSSDGKTKKDAKKKESKSGGRHPVRHFFTFLLFVFIAACAYYYYKLHVEGGNTFAHDQSGILNGYLQLQTTD